VSVAPPIKKYDQDSTRKDLSMDLRRVPGKDHRIDLSKENKE
jgi:hypothetical protein